MLNITEDATIITKRFFFVLDFLKKQKKIRGLNTFAIKYNINYWNITTLKNEPKRRQLKPEYLMYLVRDYNVSAKYLLTGEGSIFNEN